MVMVIVLVMVVVMVMVMMLMAVAPPSILSWHSELASRRAYTQYLYVGHVNYHGIHSIGHEFISKGVTSSKGPVRKGGHAGPSSSKPDRDQKPAGWCARRERASITPQGPWET